MYNHKFTRLSSYYILALLFVGLAQFASAQKFLQLELPGDPIAIKYYEGFAITYQLADYPDDWITSRIKTIDVDNNMLVFDDGFVNIKDITHVQRSRGWVKALGISLNTFGVSWLTFGGLSAAFSDYEFGWDTAVIGGVSLGLGYVLKKWLYKKKYKIGKNARLRMLDITMPSPEEVYRNKP